MKKAIHEVARQKARFIFLQEISEDVLPKLKEEPFKAFKAAQLGSLENWQFHRIKDAIIYYYDDVQTFTYIIRSTLGEKFNVKPIHAFVDTLNSWLSTFNLENFVWVTESATLTLEWWCESSLSKTSRKCVGVNWQMEGGFTTPIHPPFEFEFHSFDSARDSKKVYREAVKKSLQEKLAQYLEDKDELWKMGKHEREHFKWFAIRQLKGKTHKAIAIKFGVTEKAVEKACSEVRSLLFDVTKKVG